MPSGYPAWWYNSDLYWHRETSAASAWLTYNGNSPSCAFEWAEHQTEEYYDTFFCGFRVDTYVNNAAIHGYNNGVFAGTVGSAYHTYSCAPLYVSEYEVAGLG